MDERFDRPVRRRRVFYIPGFDPYPPRRYREFYRKEGADQARYSGYRIALRGAGPAAWEVDATIEDQDVSARVDVLVWSDIVNASMDQGIFATYLQMVRTAWIYIGSGALFRLMRLRRGPVIAALYPVAFLMLQLILAATVAGLLGYIGYELLPLSLCWIGFVVGLVAAVMLLRAGRRMDNRILAYYLMHDYAFSAGLRGAYPPALESRLDAFQDQIAAAMADPDTDEVLVVGHSSGAYLGVSVLADLLRDGRLGQSHAAVGFLSLGQVVPMVSFLPNADRLRRDLHDLSQTDALAWVDITALGDGCAFALCDPVAVSGVAPEDGQRWPLVISAAFSRTLGAEQWKRLRRAWFRLHFQYLYALPQAEDYDYFRVTAGPQTLAARYAERAPSPSTIRKPISGYRSMSP